MPALPERAVFTRADARALGWSDSSISRAIRTRQIVRVRHGWLAAFGEVDDRLAASAAAADIAGSVLSHRSALRTYDLPVVGAHPPRPEITVDPRGTGDAANARLCRATLDAVDIRIVDGIAVTAPARTIVDVGRRCPIGMAVAATDAALRRGLVTEDELEDCLRRCWNWPYIRRAQRAVTLADGRAESPLESISRLVLRWLRLPAPQLQQVVLDRHDRPAARLDFYWDDFGVAGEADGRSKYSSRDVLWAEKERQERLEDAGLVVVRWGWEEATRRPHLLRSRIEAAFERGRAEIDQVLPANGRLRRRR